MPDYDTLGFTASVMDAARELDVDPSGVHDLVRAGSLTVLLCGSSLRFHPEEIREYREHRQDDRLSASERNVARAQAAIRAYLTDVPPVDDYDTALGMGAPLWAKARSRTALHLRVDPLLEHHRVTNRGASPLTMSLVEEALKSIGAIQRRGVVPANERSSKQRWGIWWRIPASLATPEVLAEDLIKGVRDDGEPLSTKRGSGVVYLSEVMGTPR